MKFNLNINNKHFFISALFCVFSGILFSQNTTSYRISVAKSNDIDKTDLIKLRTIEYQKYVNQNGVITYLLKDSYDCILNANEALKIAKQNGYSHSVIRVVYDNDLIPIPAGNKIIEDAMREFDEGKDCPTVENNKMENQPSESSNTTAKNQGEKTSLKKDTILNNKVVKNNISADKDNKDVVWNGISYIDILYGELKNKDIHVPIEEGEISEKQKIERIKLMVSLKEDYHNLKEDSIREVIGYDVKFNKIDKPSYRVLLYSKEDTTLSKSELEKVDKIEGVVYVFHKNKNNVFTTSFYYDPLEATEKIEELKKLGFTPKLVGFYKGVIISEELANLILSAY